MVKDHQFAVFLLHAVRNETCQTNTRSCQSLKLSRKRSNSDSLRNGSQFFQIASALMLLAICVGCQAGLVDPGRSRGMNPAPPAMSIPSQGLPSPAPLPSTYPTPAGTPGANAHDWKSVSRQPATSVVEVSSEADSKAKYHTVSSGETWSSLAGQFGLTVKQLTDANGIDAGVPLKPGQIVYVP